MGITNIIELRRLLREKFPGLRTRVEELPSRGRGSWSTGLADWDDRLGGGLARAALSEIVLGRRTSGGALLLRQLIGHAAAMSQYAALVDALDSFDPAGLPEEVLARLLWVRCHDAEEALKAADLLLRDGNLPLVIIDLAGAPDAQLRRIPAPTWYRFQRIVEERGSTCLVFTPRAMISPAQTRIILQTEFDLDALNRPAAELLREVEWDVTEARNGRIDEPLRQTA